MKVGVFIPAYRESEQLGPLIETLLADTYPDKDIIVCIDEPTEKTKALIESMDGRVKFRVSAERNGKVKAINAAVKENPCDTIIFLDSDIEIRQRGFVEKVVEALDDRDLVEIKKKIIRDSFLARLVNYDYLSENFTNMLFARYLGRCLGINGSAFAINREAWDRLGGFGREICEDLDLASRAYDEKLRFGYAEEAEVHNKVNRSWRVWVDQRKRWGTGQAHWLKRRYRMLLHSVVEHPKMLLGALLLLFPSIPMFASGFAFPETFYVHLVSLLLVLFASWKIMLVSPVIAMFTGVAVLKALTAVVGAVVIYSIVFYYFARRLGYPFNPVEFIIFYFVYNPLWLMISITSLIRELIRENTLKLDWKV